MASFIELIAKIKQKNNGTFKLVDAQDVECEDGKGLDEVLNEKLDKNQGIENVGKTMVVGDDGNLVVGDSSPKNVYTKEEVDYLLDDKMDKPYVPIEITDNATITDALEGNFKIDKIKGNTYQNVETDIVPTPNRPVPINSRKTLVTKANLNIFDFEKENNTSDIPDTGTYRSIGQYQLKANTKYIFKWSEATVPAKATLSFQIQDEKGTVLVSPFTYFNLESNEKEEAGKEVEFTTNESGIVKFAYNCTVATSSTTETYQQYWYTKILKDITLKEDVEYEPEYVELRSLKETGNIWDLKPFTDINNAYYQSNDVEANCWATEQVRNLQSILKPRTTYSIRTTIEMVHKVAEEGYTNASMDKRILLYRSQHETLNDVLVDLCFTTEELNNGETRTVTKTFTTPDDLTDCKILWYTERYTTESGPSIMSTVKFKDITLVEGDSVPDSYVAPTVRDYKIVDHTTQTSKIVRNIHNVSFNKNSVWSRTGSDEKGYRFTVVEKQPLKISNYSEVNNGFSNMSNNAKNSVVNDDKSGSGWYCTSNSYVIKVDGLQMGTLDDFKQLLGDNEIIFLCQLATPVEEPITYVETDTSEIGYSWQDTTSPSPDIPSNIESVNSIEITVCGKNLFDINDEDVYLSPNITHNGNQIIKNDGSTFPRIKLKNLVIDKEYTLSYSTKLNKSISDGQLLSAISSKNMGYPDGVVLYKVGDGGTDYNVKIKFTATQSEMYLIFSIQPETITNLQIELGDTATAYEPYQGQRVDITLPQPMYQNDVANVESGDYEYEAQKYIVTGDEEFYQDYQSKAGYYGRCFNLENGNGVLTEKIWCNYLPYILVSWSLASEGCSQNARNQIHLKFSNDRLGITDNTPLEEKRLAFANYLKQLYASDGPLYVVVKVAKTTQPIPEEDLTKLKSLKTNAGVNNIFVGGEVKPTIEARYPRDLALVQQQLEQKILLISDSLIDTQAKVLLQGGN